MEQPFSFRDSSSRDIVIRRAREDDAAALIAFVQAVDAESEFLSREPGEFNVQVAQQRLLIRQVQTRRNSIYLLALDGPAVVATIDFHGGVRRRTEHAGEFGMSVRRSYWGRGIGGRLLDAVLDWAPVAGPTRRIKLRVHAGNERAIALYRSRGFEVEGVLKRELRVAGAWVDVVLMARWLEPEAPAEP